MIYYDPRLFLVLGVEVAALGGSLGYIALSDGPATAPIRTAEEIAPSIQSTNLKTRRDSSPVPITPPVIAPPAFTEPLLPKKAPKPPTSVKIHYQNSTQYAIAKAAEKGGEKSVHELVQTLRTDAARTQKTIAVLETEAGDRFEYEKQRLINQSKVRILDLERERSELISDPEDWQAELVNSANDLIETEEQRYQEQKNAAKLRDNAYSTIARKQREREREQELAAHAQRSQKILDVERHQKITQEIATTTKASLEVEWLTPDRGEEREFRGTREEADPAWDGYRESWDAYQRGEISREVWEINADGAEEILDILEKQRPSPRARDLKRELLGV